MRRSLSIGGSSSVQWRKGGRSWRLRMCFRRLLCVRIEIDQLHCVNCWVIIHCLSVSCTKINHSRCALVIWSSLQLTSKQWIITQQFTAGADLFLNSNTPRLYSQWLNSVIYWLINHCTHWARTGVTSFGRHFLIFMTSSIKYGNLTLTIDGVTSFLQLLDIQNVRKNTHFRLSMSCGKFWQSL